MVGTENVPTLPEAFLRCLRLVNNQIAREVLAITQGLKASMRDAGVSAHLCEVSSTKIFSVRSMSDSDTPRHFLTLLDLTPDELRGLVQRATELKVSRHQHEPYEPLKNRTLGMIFEKSSTRTRVSFEAGMVQFSATVTWPGFMAGASGNAL